MFPSVVHLSDFSAGPAIGLGSLLQRHSSAPLGQIASCCGPVTHTEKRRRTRNALRTRRVLPPGCGLQPPASGPLNSLRPPAQNRGPLLSAGPPSRILQWKLRKPPGPRAATREPSSLGSTAPGNEPPNPGAAFADAASASASTEILGREPDPNIGGRSLSAAPERTFHKSRHQDRRA